MEENVVLYIEHFAEVDPFIQGSRQEGQALMQRQPGKEEVNQCWFYTEESEDEENQVKMQLVPE